MNFKLSGWVLHRIGFSVRVVGQDRMLPVGKPECKKLKAGRLEQQVPVLVGEVGYPGDPVTEVSYDVDGGGEEVVELGDLHCFVFHQT